MYAFLALRVSLVREKLQIVVVVLFAEIIQILEPLHIQVEIVSSQIQIATSWRRVTFKLVV